MGKIIYEKQTVTESKSESKADFIKDKGSSKTYRGYLNGCLKKAINSENKEMVILLRELLMKFNEFYPNRIIKSEIEIIDGWKGIDNIEIFRGFTEDFVIKSHTKDKETGEVTTTHHTIKREDVNRLFFYIKKWEIGETHKCYDFAGIVGEKDWKEVWKKRTDVYFPLYYFPIKCLEAMGLIKYSGRGDITRIK